MASTHSGITIGHVCRALFVNSWYEADAGGRKNIKSIHVSGTDDSENVGNAVGYKRFDECLTRCHSWHGEKSSEEKILKKNLVLTQYLIGWYVIVIQAGSDLFVRNLAMTNVQSVQQVGVTQKCVFIS